MGSCCLLFVVSCVLIVVRRLCFDRRLPVVVCFVLLIVCCLVCVHCVCVLFARCALFVV